MEPKEKSEEIEITPEMIEAGLRFLYRFNHEGDEREIISQIYRAMALAVPK